MDYGGKILQEVKMIPAIIPSCPAKSEPEEPEEALKPWAEEACDSIDAGFFSGDTFFAPEAIKRMEWYLGRWCRQLAVIQQQNAEIAEMETEPVFGEALPGDPEPCSDCRELYNEGIFCEKHRNRGQHA
jgi:hypothetical protein